MHAAARTKVIRVKGVRTVRELIRTRYGTPPPKQKILRFPGTEVYADRCSSRNKANYTPVYVSAVKVCAAPSFGCGFPKRPTGGVA